MWSWCCGGSEGGMDDLGTAAESAPPPAAPLPVVTDAAPVVAGCGVQPANVDYEALNCAIDAVAADLVESYLTSKLYRSTTVCESLDRTVLEVSTRHSVAILANALLPYALPKMTEAFKCEACPYTPAGKS